MLALYARLYWVLSKAHSRFLNFNSSTGDQQYRSDDLASGQHGISSHDDARHQEKNTRRFKKVCWQPGGGFQNFEQGE